MLFLLLSLPLLALQLPSFASSSLAVGPFVLLINVFLPATVIPFPLLFIAHTFLISFRLGRGGADGDALSMSSRRC